MKRPATPYAASKLACDALVESYVDTFELDAVIVRPFNTIGPRQNEGSYAAVIPETMRRIREGRAPIHHRKWAAVEGLRIRKGRRRGRHPGSGTRDSGQTYVMATGETHTIRDVVEKTSACCRIRGTIDTAPARAGDVYRLCGDPSKAMMELGWKPTSRIRRRAEKDGGVVQ